MELAELLSQIQLYVAAQEGVEDLKIQVTVEEQDPLRKIQSIAEEPAKVAHLRKSPVGKVEVEQAVEGGQS